jgi:DNA topoisomerase-2
MEKRQRVRHLSVQEWVWQRPENFFGAMEPAPLTFASFGDDGAVAWTTTTLCHALVVLLNELVVNALDNVHRDASMRTIRIQWKDGVFSVTNDGAVLSTQEVDAATDLHGITLAFGVFQSGTNFDDLETGKKEVAYVAGRNGVGAKGCNLFGTRFVVKVGNAAEHKLFQQVWERNMNDRFPPKITAYARKTNETTVEWTPDAGRRGAPECMDQLCRWIAHNASLCAPPAVKVSYNGDALKLRSCEHFCRALGGTGRLASETVVHNGVPVLRLCVAARDEERDGATSPPAGLTYAFVNSTPCPEGSHAVYLLGKIAKIVEDKAKAKHKDVHVTASFLQAHAVVVAVVLVDNERYTDQRKRTLDTPVRDWGWKWDKCTDAFRAAVEASPLVARAVAVAKHKEEAGAAKATKATRHPTIAKYDPALVLHKGLATLLVAEGDSAKNFVTAGLSVVSRKLYGVYPIRGKFLNVREESSKTILGNKEAVELLKILGIQLHTTYTPEMVRKLPYARLMVISDQDVDGSHIAGLLYNLIDVCAPSLLECKPDFLCRFATSLIRVRLPKKEKGGEVGFYSQTEYDAWCAQRAVDGKTLGTARYYKGLGTSTAAEAKSYFSKLAEHSIVFRHEGAVSSQSLDLAFHKKRSDDRKAFLTTCDLDAYVDYSLREASMTTFVERELLPQYSMASIKRAIPALDGFKESLRKVFFGARTMGLTQEVSVANAAGEIASRTNYHHRGTALADAIIGMAADYAGTSNVNLLNPKGQFGTRHNHTAASAAYPCVTLNAPVHAALFPPEDDAVLPRVVDEGKEVEPVVYAPVLAAPLLFGANGIATGWSTNVPMYNPKEVVEATKKWLSGEDLPALTPFYRGFKGEVVKVDDTTFLLRGACEWKGADLHVTDLPPPRESDAYKEDWIKAEVAPGGVFIGEHHTDEVVHYVLKQCILKTDDPVKELGMERKISTSNMHLLDADGRLKKYADPREILVDHAHVRLQVYEARLRHLIVEGERAARLATNRATYVSLCVEGRLVPASYADAAAADAACAEVGLDRVDGSYDYLHGMSISSLHQSKVAALRTTAATKTQEVEALRSKTPKDLWRSDLERLSAVFATDARL